jgi:neutral ceramidase
MAVSELRAGTARVTITPPVGIPLQGYDRGRPSEGIRDDLYARALVLERGDVRVALVCADVIGLEPASVSRTRDLIQDATGIPGTAVCLACSHTHAGPAVMLVCRRDPPDPDYTRTLERAMAGAVAMAARYTQPVVSVTHGEGRCGFNVNRRLLTPNGVVMRPNPEGPQDRRVQVVRLAGEGAAPPAVLFRYACHPTSLTGGNFRFSGDYPGGAARAIESLFGGGTMAFFLPGCFGDLRPHLTTPDGNFRGATDAELDRLGRVLGAEVVRVAEECASDAPAGAVDDRLAAAAEPLALPYVDLPSAGALQRAIEEAEMEPFAAEILARRERGEVRVEVQAIRLGPVMLIALPGEVMNGIGAAIERSLEPTAIVMGYTNANPGYLCTAEAMAEGGYEPTCFMTSYHHPAPFTSETERLLARAAAAAVRSLE